MSRPPIKAMESIKNYCEKTQCRRCVFGEPTAYNFVGCKLLDNLPFDWSNPNRKERGRMTHKTAKEILKMEKDKLMSEPESNRDWELITALDIAIEAIENEILGEDERRRTMNNNLISREDLKKAIDDAVCNFELPISASEIMPIIDNAPTVEPTFKPIAEVKFDKEQLQAIVDKAKAEVLASVERPQGEYERAFEIACDLLNGSNLYGIDADNLFALIMQKYGIVSTLEYQEFILEHLDRFSDDDEIRLKAVERLGW